MDRRSWKRQLAAVARVAVRGTGVGRLLGYRLDPNTVVRCRRGHLFTTIWIPGMKLKALD
jgi:hypothetical protein